MLFITNRLPRQSIKTRIHRNFDFDLANNAPSHSAFFCERLGRDVYEELGSRRFLERLGGVQPRQVLLYLHGDGHLPEEVFPTVEELQALCNAQGPEEVLLVPLIWPCDAGQGVIREDWDDRASAALSGLSVARVLQRLHRWRLARDEDALPAGRQRLSVLAHGLGARVLAEGLGAWREHFLPMGIPLTFRHAFLAAADLDAAALATGGEGEAICHAARQVTLYFAAADLHLARGSAGRRLGQVGPEDPSGVPGHVILVDCDELSQRYDPRQGHVYFRSGEGEGEPGAVCRHLFAALMAGRVFAEDEARRQTILKEG